MSRERASKLQHRQQKLIFVFWWCRSTGSFVLLPGELLPGVPKDDTAGLLPENSIVKRERSVSVFGRHRDPDFWGGSLPGRLCCVEWIDKAGCSVKSN